MKEQCPHCNTRLQSANSFNNHVRHYCKIKHMQCSHEFISPEMNGSKCKKCGLRNQPITMQKSEYDRLKRLDDNLRKSIKELDGALANELAVCFESKAMQIIKEILEDLYK